ncbi:MAG: NADH:flavin oxidoreductase, partial [Rhodobacteraceae bacterium]|nr:NADH:flavin oxidoreductase [Paracoccaceae bacterium]
MTGNQDYSVLFEPVKIGPKTAPNRFYQVPHCNGFGYVRPRGEAAMRGMKAAGGWGVVATQETEVHPTSDLSPFAEGRNWDDRDIPAMRLMAEAVQDHGSLAAIQLVHNGHHSYNSLTRLPIMGVRDMAGETSYPRQARAMDRDDIRNVRRWHREAALRAKAAGFDIVYVYAGHNMSVAQHFLSPVYNDRSDEYGGSLENRARLLRELLEDTKEAVGDTCAVALRFAVDCVDGGYTADSQGREVVEMLADLPDLWDVNVSNWPRDSVTSRFEPNDGAQLPYIDWVKQVTTKPVVGVGRFTSPDRMASLVKKGVLDFIGAARPSIADPFLPRKIEEGRIDEIRECIGCNVCVSADSQAVPIRCTQNPTMGEEWRRGWHPERIAPKGDEEAA